MSYVKNIESQKYEKYRCIITDEICGKILLKCNDEKVFYKTLGVNPTVTLKITNTSECIMDIIIKRGKHCGDKIIPVLPKSEIVMTISSVRKISARYGCLTENSKCTGCFTLIIHYPFHKQEKKCHERYHCNLDTCKDDCMKW